MTDLMAFGGPAGPCFAQKVAWQRETAIISVSANTPKGKSDEQQAVYSALAARDGYGWKAMAQKAGIDPANLGNLGIGGFSAFHGFANAFLKNPADFDRCCYVHLADACFLGAGATQPHAGYAAFAKQAALGNKMLTVTTNGPWGKDIHYSWTYPDGTVYRGDLTSGAKCFELAFNASGAAGMNPTTPEVPPGLPQPSRSFRVGNLIWLHYETMTSGLPKPCGGEYSPHGWHVTALAIPTMSFYGAPWMAGKGRSEGGGGLVLPGLGSGGSNASRGLLAVGAAGLVAYLMWHFMTRRG